MPEPQPDDVSPAEAVDAASTSVLLVIVQRSGGIAGLTRTWRVEPAPAEREAWIELVRRCPWDDGADRTDPDGADRFRWAVSVQSDTGRHRAELGDAQLSGPWRDLVDAVRSGRPADRRGPA